jgi:hypothetical protein
MLDDRDLTALLDRPAVVAAVLELGVSALQVKTYSLPFDGSGRCESR